MSTHNMFLSRNKKNIRRYFLVDKSALSRAMNGYYKMYL